MSIFYDLDDNETLSMGIDKPSGDHVSERITIGYPTEKEMREEEDKYISIIVSSMNKEKPRFSFSQIFPSLEELEIIIKALQKAKKIMLNRKDKE